MYFTFALNTFTIKPILCIGRVLFKAYQIAN